MAEPRPSRHSGVRDGQETDPNHSMAESLAPMWKLTGSPCPAAASHTGSQ